MVLLYPLTDTGCHKCGQSSMVDHERRWMNTTVLERSNEMFLEVMDESRGVVIYRFRKDRALA
jgi:hypothetical protein